MKINDVMLLTLLSLQFCWNISSLYGSEPASESVITIKEPGVIVKLKGIDEAYGRAFATILSTARTEYENIFRFTPDETLILEARYDPDEKLRLYTDGRSRIFLVISSPNQLAPPTQSGVYNIYGMCHEIGHIAMYSRMSNVVGLPRGVGEGWAHYAGSTVIDAVAAKLGDSIWPQPYDIAATEGMARLRKQTDGKDWKDLDDTACAAKVFYEIEKKYGRDILCQTFDQALSKRPTGGQFMPLFVQALKDATGRPDAADWIPQQVLEYQVKWNVKERRIEDAFFDDVHISHDKTGTTLYYDDGTSENHWSTGGSGHAVLFQTPLENMQVDHINVFGSRYGGFFAPREDFLIYLCDEDFNILHEFTRPYALFKRGKDRWHTINIEPVDVPPRFYVCLYFNPIASRGIYIGCDENVTRSHSFRALPRSFVNDIGQKSDWMIRVHLQEKRAGN